MSSKATKGGVVTQTGGKAPRKALAVWSAKRTAPKSGGVKKEKGVRVAVTVEGGDGQTRAGERERKRKAGVGGGESAGMRKRTVESIMTEGAEGVVEKEVIPSSLQDTESEAEDGKGTSYSDELKLLCSESMCAGNSKAYCRRSSEDSVRLSTLVQVGTVSFAVAASSSRNSKLCCC